MTRQVPFTKQEAALLLDAYLTALNGALTRHAAIRKCSEELRRMAKNKGLEIDEIYRNVNGITFQMASMESAYKGKTIVKPATKLFTEIVALYRDDRDGYDRILKEAKQMADLKKDQEAVFVAWLSEKLSAAQLSEIYMALHEIEQQAIKAKLIRKSLYENLDAALVKKIRINIEQSRFFKITHKRQMGRITSALNYLTQYATESDKKMENSTATVITEKSESLPAVEEKSSIANNANEGLSIDFSNIGNIAFTKPYELTYFGEAYKVNSWKDAYVRACGCLFEDYPDEFERFRDDCIHGSGKVWIVDSTNVYRLAVAKEVSKGYFVETNRSASDLMKNLKWIVDACRVDYENIQIRYSGKENAEDMTTDTEQVTTAVPERKYQRDDKENFFNWMRDNQKMAEATCRSYVSAIRTSEKFAVSHSFKHKDFFSADAQGAKALADELFNDSEFIELNESQHNRFRAAITKYLLYLGSDWSPTKAFTSSHHVLDYSVVQDEEIDAKPYMHVLVENFPRGYRLGSALDMKRLRRFYEEITGTTLELDTII